LIIFEIGSYFMPRPAWTCPPICAFLCSWDDRHLPAYSAIGWDVSHEFFCLGWPGIVLLPVSAFQVARITVMGHHTWILFTF
jgi:hypothetical protein